MTNSILERPLMSINRAILFLSCFLFSTTIFAQVQWSANGHYYKFVDPVEDITWEQAKNAAAEETHMGLKGYLVTITSAEEMDFVNSIATNHAWIGASDAEVEGTWKWVTGPEAGTTFWQGGPTEQGGTGTGYSNWGPSQPDFNGIDEDGAHFYVGSKLWNDQGGAISGGYVIEYSVINAPPQGCAPCGNKKDKKVSVCHNGHMICISENALQAHLDHGDNCGPCVTQSANAVEEIGAPNAAPIMLDKAGSVYPNPTSGVFNVTVPASPFSDVQILISDFSGKTIERRVVKANSQQQLITFDYSQKSKGIYFIRVVGKTTASPRKVIIK